MEGVLYKWTNYISGMYAVISKSKRYKSWKSVKQLAFLLASVVYINEVKPSSSLTVAILFPKQWPTQPHTFHLLKPLAEKFLKWCFGLCFLHFWQWPVKASWLEKQVKPYFVHKRHQIHCYVSQLERNMSLLLLCVFWRLAAPLVCSWRRHSFLLWLSRRCMERMQGQHQNICVWNTG